MTGLHRCLLVSAFCVSAWCQDWNGSLTLTDDPTGAPGNGKAYRANCYLPDVSKPVRGAMILSWAYNDRDWRAVAAEFNCLIISTTLNHQDVSTNGRKILALLKQAAQQLPAHPEIAHTGVILHGWSQAAAGATRTASLPELANRVLAVVGIHEIDPAPWLAPVSVPHLFISGWPDGYSALLGAYHGQERTMDRAKAGAPITMVNDVGHDHIDVCDNYAFTRVWLEEVLKRRLPAKAPVDADIVLPDWTNDPQGWLGTYDIATGTGVAPWGEGQRLCNVAIAPRATYVDHRQAIWLPSQRCAQVWEVYSSVGRMPTLGTLTPPMPTAPVITHQPQSITVMADQPVCLSAEVTATPPAIYRWFRVKGTAKDMVSSAATYFTWSPGTPNHGNTDYDATFYLVATNEAGTATSQEVTVHLGTTNAPPMLLCPGDLTGLPQDTSVAVGDTATFTVWGQGSPKPTIQWRRNGMNIIGATSASYTTGTLLATDTGSTYDAVLTNSVGSIISRTAHLTVGPHLQEPHP